MIKQKQIKIYSFGRSNIHEGNIISNNLEENVITLTESFLTLAFECYKNQKLENGQFIDEIVKVVLPPQEEKAKEEWFNGLLFNDKKYYAWFATTGGMKKENGGKCETIFIREDFRLFAEEFEELISLGKFKELEETEEKICINKDVLSRISLTTSSCYNAGEMPNFIVLPQPKLSMIKDYKTIMKKLSVEVENDEVIKETVDYDFIHFHFDDKIDIFDGGGIATPMVFKQIQKELKLNYDCEFAIIRGYGLGIKGMITKFDIIRFLNTFYKEDTEYCKKVNDTYYLLDMWEEWQPVTDSTILLNESMVKFRLRDIQPITLKKLHTFFEGHV